MFFKFIDNAGVRFYRCRNPFSSPLWVLLDKYYDQFESDYAERFEKVYEVNPMKCPKCGEQMRIIAFIDSRTKRERQHRVLERALRTSNRDQPDVIKKILKHCNLWREPVSRAPPKFVLEHEYIPIDEFLANF